VKMTYSIVPSDTRIKIQRLILKAEQKMLIKENDCGVVYISYRQ